MLKRSLNRVENEVQNNSFSYRHFNHATNEVIFNEYMLSVEIST